MAGASDKQAYRPYPHLARAIRSETEAILAEWRARTMAAFPELPELTQQEFRDDVASILAAMADALESNDEPDLRRMALAAPSHGFHRFLQDYDLADLFAEERVLRRVIVSRVERSLARQCDPGEAGALHGLIDIMLQQGVLALVHRQKQDLRRSSEAELKYASFISHDFANSFFVIRSNLEMLEERLAGMQGMDDAVTLLRATQEVMARTRQGMQSLLSYQRVRRTDAGPRVVAVRLRDVVDPLVRVDAEANKSVRTEVAIEPDATGLADDGLLNIVLQNLLGNAIKHAAKSGKGKVRIQAARDVGGTGGKGGKGSMVSSADGEVKIHGTWTISVIDNGPGIPQAEVAAIFEPFKQLGEAANLDGGAVSDGMGLGLTIAKEAAKLMGTEIRVRSRVGEGSTFSIDVPAAPGPSGA